MREFVRGLTEHERTALVTRDVLYLDEDAPRTAEVLAAAWVRFREDLENRAAGRAYMFKLVSRIEEDLRSIKKLGAYEQRAGVDLSEYVKKEGR